MVHVGYMQRLYATGELFHSRNIPLLIPWGDNIQGQNAWHESLDLSKLSDDERYKILEYVVNKVGRDRVQAAFGITRYTMWRLLKKRVRIDDDKLKIFLGFLTPQEFQEVLSSHKLLEGIGVVRRDGTINYSIVMEILKEASRDEYLKQPIIRFVVDNFREDLKRFMGYSITNIELR